MKQTKYIVFEDDHGLEDIIIFSELQQHANILRLGLTPVSAGFIEITSESLHCYGDSISLNLKSRPEDTKIAKRALNYP